MPLSLTIILRYYPNIENYTLHPILLQWFNPQNGRNCLQIRYIDKRGEATKCNTMTQLTHPASEVLNECTSLLLPPTKKKISSVAESARQAAPKINEE